MPTKDLQGQSREALAMDDVHYKNKKTSTTTKLLAVVAVLMTIAVIVLAVLYGLSVNNQAGKFLSRAYNKEVRIISEA